MKQPKKYLYCAKNVVYQWAYQDNYCDGPNGAGIEESCIDECSNACTDEKTLSETIWNACFKPLITN